MSLVLGIDTGGTYTDGVIVDRATKAILTKAKALTTRENLAFGIVQCINNLQFDHFQDISVVSLSTTLATNAIVEGRGCEVGLIMIGHEPRQELPVKEIRLVSGGHDVKGQEARPLDMEAVKAAVNSLSGKVEAIAISGFLSVRNPAHELAVATVVHELTDLPVVCAHHLTRSLGVHERTVTAVLNARLIPIIKELLEAVKVALKEKGIEAALMVVKGDGSLMSEAGAKDKPIETILSGPASSLMGAIFLANEKDAFVLDMGGTTTDIALLKNGVPRIGQNGAEAGGWRTMVEAAEIFTYGLGGDSYIQLTESGTLAIGPQRVWPISVVARQHPGYVQALKKVNIPKSYKLIHAQATDGFMLLKPQLAINMSEDEKKALALLLDGPKTLCALAETLDIGPNLLNLTRLVNVGALARISLTPTDILHANGEYVQWNQEAALLGVDILAGRMGISREALIQKAVHLTVDALCYTLLQSISNVEGNSFSLKDNPVAKYLIDRQLSGNPSETMLQCQLTPTLPVVGIGAPVQAWLPKMIAKLKGRLVIPPNPEVANAVGSATGKIMETVKILIHPGNGDEFVLHAPWEMKTFAQLEEATRYALATGEEKARALALEAGAKDFTVVTAHRDVYARASMTDNDVYIETHVEAVAVERPEWEREDSKENFFVDTRNRGMRLNG